MHGYCWNADLTAAYSHFTVLKNSAFLVQPIIYNVNHVVCFVFMLRTEMSYVECGCHI